MRRCLIHDSQEEVSYSWFSGFGICAVVQHDLQSLIKVKYLSDINAIHQVAKLSSNICVHRKRYPIHLFISITPRVNVAPSLCIHTFVSIWINGHSFI